MAPSAANSTPLKTIVLTTLAMPPSTFAGRLSTVESTLATPPTTPESSPSFASPWAAAPPTAAVAMAASACPKSSPIISACSSGEAIANRCDLVVGIEVVEEEAVVVRPLIGEDAAQNLRLARELQEQAVQVVTSIRIGPWFLGELLLPPFAEDLDDPGVRGLDSHVGVGQWLVDPADDHAEVDVEEGG